jgi:N-acetylglucosaminyldiphosphoundecaprenol N-acetyl-beta-D-mannosaminyltransferase
VLIAVRAPQQEILAHAMLERGDATGVGLCVGEGLEILAGVARQAPEWMQKGGLAWVHRLVTDPGRLGERYLVDGPAILGLWGRWRSQRRAAMTSRSSR